jgi:uncharacterized protein YktA (UPF0223 family)
MLAFFKFKLCYFLNLKFVKILSKVSKKKITSNFEQKSYHFTLHLLTLLKPHFDKKFQMSGVILAEKIPTINYEIPEHLKEILKSTMTFKKISKSEVTFKKFQSQHCL